MGIVSLELLPLFDVLAVLPSNRQLRPITYLRVCSVSTAAGTFIPMAAIGTATAVATTATTTGTVTSTATTTNVLIIWKVRMSRMKYHSRVS
jgi:hypothetical protein